MPPPPPLHTPPDASSPTTLLSLRRTFYPLHTQPPSVFTFTHPQTSPLSSPTPIPSSSLPALRTAIATTLTLARTHPHARVLLATARLWDARVHDLLLVSDSDSNPDRDGLAEGEEPAIADGGDESMSGNGAIDPGANNAPNHPSPNTPRTIQTQVSDLALRSIYSMALIRFVGAFVDRDVRRSVTASLGASLATTAGLPDPTVSVSQQQHKIQQQHEILEQAGVTPPVGPKSMLAHALALGLPVEFVGVRHEAVHEEGEGPGLGVLREKVGEALEWLWERWWRGLDGDGGGMGVRLERGEGIGEKGVEGRKRKRKRWTEEELEGLGEEELRGLVEEVIERERERVQESVRS